MISFGPVTDSQLIPLIGTGVLIVAWAAAGVIALVYRRRRGPVITVAGAPAVSVVRLSKKYGDRVVLDDVSFDVPAGRVVALLGPNGAGKTTLLRAMAGLVEADAGRVAIFGSPVAPGAPILTRVGITIDEPGVVPHLTGREGLTSLWKIGGRDRADAQVDTVVELTGLARFADQRAETYSMGTRQRLALAQAMLGLPDVLILDEPTNGLDPDQIRDLVAALARYAATGRTVVVATHQLPELAPLCTDALVLRDGAISWAGPLDSVVGAAFDDAPACLDRLSAVYRAANPRSVPPDVGASLSIPPARGDSLIGPSPRALSVRTEIGRQLQRRGTWVILLAATVLPLALAGVLAAGNSRFVIEGDVIGALASSSAGNFTVMMLYLGCQLLLVVVVAYLFGEAIARESQWRYLRVLATVPVSRSRLVLVKAAALAVIVAATAIVFAVVSYVIGWAFFGTGMLLPIAGPGVTGSAVPIRLAMMLGYILVYLTWIAALALLLSTLAGDNTTVAVTGTIAVTLGGHLLGALGALGPARGLLPTRNYAAWLDASRTVFDPTQAMWGLFVSLLYASTLVAGALVVLNVREIRR
ncbi:MAG: ATP-binding cassette domain-containing protein [Gordonia sp. (in: high G+C Gram-positive bacteria)]|uniref:ABC transporter ATP-binding protein n=1 Tax=Gordonia sp. (in: high G+C Gram-positive bacteria) TaxID=84139 RepID=UPI003BB49785